MRSSVAGLRSPHTKRRPSILPAVFNCGWGAMPCFMTFTYSVYSEPAHLSRSSHLPGNTCDAFCSRDQPSRCQSKIFGSFYSQSLVRISTPHTNLVGWGKEKVLKFFCFPLNADSFKYMPSPSMGNGWKLSCCPVPSIALLSLLKDAMPNYRLPPVFIEPFLCRLKKKGGVN